jgi:hypothetical protein
MSYSGLSKERLMKKVACALTLVFAPLLVIGCDSPGPPAPIAPSQPDPSPPVKNGPKPAARKKKQPGLHSPASPTHPRANF